MAERLTQNPGPGPWPGFLMSCHILPRWNRASRLPARDRLLQRLDHGCCGIPLERVGMGFCVDNEGMDELQGRGLLRRARSEHPAPILVDQHRKVLDRLHVSPAE